jgi:8-oxo-dGTP diphosphatase
LQIGLFQIIFNERRCLLKKVEKYVVGRRLTDEEYQFIFDRVPRLCIDIVVVKQNGILFFKREIEPFKGKWTLPGGAMRMGENFDTAHQRILNAEFGPKVKCIKKRIIGVCNHWPDGPNRHSVSILFQTVISGRITGSDQGHEIKIISDFTEKSIQPFHQKWFLDSTFLDSNIEFTC